MRFLVLVTILFITEVIFIKLAKKFSIVDSSRGGNIHLRETVRGGGVIFFVSTLYYHILSNFQYSLFFSGLTILSIVSLIDDVKSLSIVRRLFFQFLSISLILLELDFRVTSSWFYICVGIICVGIINAYNFMDGINGITGGYSTIVILALWVVNNYHTKFIENDFLIFTALGLMVFNYFNFRTKAQCFAGDVGSISMAVIVLFLLLKLMLQEQNLVYILFLSIYGVDSVLTIIHRLLLKENIFKAHRLHLFQVLVDTLKIPHLVMASIYMLIQSIICCGIIVSLNYPLNVQLMAGFSLIILLVFAYIVVKHKVMALTV